MKDVFVLPRKASREVALMLTRECVDDEEYRIKVGKRRYLDLRSQIIKELRQGYPPVIFQEV